MEGYRFIHIIEPSSGYITLEDDPGLYTLAIKEPDIKDIETVLTAYRMGETPITLPIQVGLAKVHEEDNYCRKTGREMAMRHLGNIRFHFDGIWLGSGFYEFHIYSQSHPELIHEQLQHDLNLRMIYRIKHQSIHFHPFDR